MNFCCCVAATCDSSRRRVQIPTVPGSCQSSACLKHLTFFREHMIMCKWARKIRSDVLGAAKKRPEKWTCKQTVTHIQRVFMENAKDFFQMTWIFPTNDKSEKVKHPNTDDIAEIATSADLETPFTLLRTL